MAITIQAQLAKKVPLPGHDFASKQASITITAEVTDLNQVGAEANRLYAIAERSVDAQLGVTTQSEPQPTSNTSFTPAQRWTPPAANGSSNQQRTVQRRAPAPATDSQLRFITRLLDSGKGSLNAILAQHQVGDLRDLSCKAAAGLIDSLKAAA